MSNDNLTVTQLSKYTCETNILNKYIMPYVSYKRYSFFIKKKQILQDTIYSRYTLQKISKTVRYTKLGRHGCRFLQ